MYVKFFQVLSLSPSSNTLDISILRDPAVLDIDTFKYFTEIIVVQMDRYPMNKNSQPTVYDISDTTVQRNNNERPHNNIVVIHTKESGVDTSTTTYVIIAVVVGVVVLLGVAASCCLWFVVFKPRKQRSENKNNVGMENKGVEVYEWAYVP